SLCVKDAFAKNFLVSGENSAGGAVASVLRKHSSEGRTADAVERCDTHCGVAPSRGTATCRPDSERFRAVPKVPNASMHKDLRRQTLTSRAIGDKRLFREV